MSNYCAYVFKSGYQMLEWPDQPPGPCSASAWLQLLDMPEEILQHMARCMSTRQCATGPALTCRMLNELPLLVMKVRMS